MTGPLAASAAAMLVALSASISFPAAEPFHPVHPAKPGSALPRRPAPKLKAPLKPIPEEMDFEPLWPNGAPGALGSTPGDRPGLTFFFPESTQANGSAVIVCPGGAYGMLARDKEGVQPSLWLKSLGVRAFLLDYRVGPAYRHPVEVGDGLRAVRWVRANALRFGLDPRRIGMLGFSAGGHLTATVASFFDDGDSGSPDPVERASSRPDFQILIYPVISMQAPFAHLASRINLLGRSPSAALLDSLSADRHVDARTPPAFIVHAEDDPVVAYAHGQAYAEALREAKVPVEFLGFVQGGHAFGLAADKTGAPGEAQLATWPSLCEKWMGARGMLAQPRSMGKERTQNEK